MKIREGRFFPFLLLFFVGCQSPDIPKDTAILLVENSPRTPDPLWATDAISQNLHNLTHSALISIGADMKPQPELAESWTIKAYRKFHFRLRANLKFEDGSTLTAGDVHNSISAFADSSAGAPHADIFAHIREIRVLNDREIEFSTDTVAPYLLWDLTSMKIFKKQGDRIIGAGRFRANEFNSQIARLERNPFFYESPKLGAIQKIIVRVVREDITRYQLFRRGDANAAFNSLALTTTAALKRDLPRDLKVFEAPGVNIGYLAMNFRNPKLADIRVRRAIAHALNIDEILKFRLEGMCYRATGLLGPIHGDYDAQTRRYDYDTGAAEKLLDEAGFHKNADGVRFSLEFKTTGDKSALDFARILSESLRKIGIRLTIRTSEFGTFYSDIKQ